MHFTEDREKERKKGGRRTGKKLEENIYKAHGKVAFTYDHWNNNNRKSALHIYMYIYMYDIVQHVAGTSNAIARGSDGNRLEKLWDREKQREIERDKKI